MRICHLTSAHYRYDTRIFLKEAISLAHNHTVFVIVSDSMDDEINNNVSIKSTRYVASNKISRFVFSAFKVFILGLKTKSDVYHAHDPELIPYIFILRILGKKVVFDIHEFFPLQILSKSYLPWFFRKFISLFFSFLEYAVCLTCSGVVVALSPLEKRFKRVNHRIVTINNYPFKDELTFDDFKSLESEESNFVIFVGGITPIRGLAHVINALEGTDIKLKLVGKFSGIEYYEYCKNLNGWSNVIELGFLDRKSVAKELSTCFAGIVTYLPVPNHINAQPTKLFEYMSAGLPVISSNFPLWKDIVQNGEVGLCVNPASVIEIREAILNLKNDPGKRSKMAHNAINAIKTKYNWESEALRLTEFYSYLS